MLTFAVLASIAAVFRLFAKALLEPMGVPTIAGSLLVSITVVLLVGMGLIFAREGRNPNGRYMRAVAWSILLAAWCELLIIGGILATEALGTSTYYQGPWEQVREVFPTGASHAIGHMQGFIFRLMAYLILASIVYLIARRMRLQHSYSARSNKAGSTDIARREGTNVASTPTTRMIRTGATNTGQRGESKIPPAPESNDSTRMSVRFPGLCRYRPAANSILQ